ncbi:DnaJ C-terminal domain-containing protein [Swingsia samuiensis]|uniref:J domain-containing protein n=1 Tax=Swingsia samuiensis TaxID=1293412 RepID=A0A4Y6ULD4_9PROT|nr:DnaJ C-terminal domain-containing protein [Swingsia samuiensis]QDH17167.1 J domain-containing protein [Swingsia samuiensis]
MKDPYSVLGVSKNATDKEIRSAYRKLAKKYHPDHNPDSKEAEEQFKAVGQAYNIIGDKEKRARFDRGEIDGEGQERGPFGGGGFGGGGFGGGGFGGGAGAHGFQGNFSQEDLGAFFSDMFGGGGFSGDFRPGGAGGRRAAKGADRRYSVTIPFVQAILGTSLELNLGEGNHTEVRIPAGVEDGQTLRVRGKGAPGRPGMDGQPGVAGDALITVSVTPDKRYVREGRNVRMTQNIDLKIAVLGGKVTVQTPRGDVAVKVPKHSDSGKVLRLGGRGVGANKKEEAGDLLVTLQIQLGHVTPELEAFFEKQES